MVDGQVQAVAVDDDELVDGALSESQLSSLGTKAGKGLRWALVGNLIMKVGSFTLSLAMVRLLAPHDFGLYAVALAANSFLIHVNDAGLIAATVQWRGRVEEMLATARTMAISVQPRRGTRSSGSAPRSWREPPGAPTPRRWCG